MTTVEFGFLLVGVSLVTFHPRYLPMVFLSKREVSPSFKRWMSFIPVSIFAALVASDAFFIGENFSLHLIENYKIIPSIAVLLVALKTKSLFWSVITGIVSMIIMGILT